MKHLTDEQLAEWLAGESGEETRTHLRNCASCNAEAINMREGVLRYSMALRRQSALAQSAQLPGNFAPGKVLVWHRLRWVGAGVLAILLTAQTAWMMKPHTVPQITRPVANSQPNPQPNTQSGDQMSDDELLEAVNNDLSRDVPQALAPVSAITLARNQIAAETSKSNESSR